jgi:hypothetical protein
VSYWTVAQGLRGKVPGTPLSLAQEALQDALGKIYDQTDWSFQRAITYGGWLCPGQIANTGTFTTTPYSAAVIADSTATAALAAHSGMPLLTTLQFRNPAYSLYNIIGYNPTGSGSFATLTLDRPWMEPLSGSGQSYMIYQAYFVAPVADFRKFIEVRDTTNAFRLNFWGMTQAELAIRDPQRTNFSDPEYVVPAGIDQRPGSATLGYQMFELWPQQLSYVPYSFSFRRRGVVPQTLNDFQTLTTPYPITEEMLKWRALEVLYQFKEAQKDKTEARGSGANWLLLAQMAHKEYLEEFDKILAIDLNINGEMMTRIERRGRTDGDSDYSNQLGQLHIGRG